jgi:hypothetical protein
LKKQAFKTEGDLLAKSIYFEQPKVEEEIKERFSTKVIKAIEFHRDMNKTHSMMIRTIENENPDESKYQERVRKSSHAFNSLVDDPAIYQKA